MDVRTLPRHEVVGRLKDARVTQRSIAERLGVSQTYVCNVIGHRAVVRPTKKSEAVWRAIEKVLAHHQARHLEGAPR